MQDGEDCTTQLYSLQPPRAKLPHGDADTKVTSVTQHTPTSTVIIQSVMTTKEPACRGQVVSFS